MTLRADHVAGGFFVAFGLLVLAISGDLPVGSLSSPGSGFLPKILAGLTILFGLTLTVRAGESKAFASLAWDDLAHAALVVLIIAAAVLLFERLGFVATAMLMIFALLVVIERRRLLAAAIYSIAIVTFTYALFVYVLKTPLVTGPFGF
jgi:hypothetical protein